MEITGNRDYHLTYCTNIHPGESWEEHFKELKTYLPELKQRLSPEKPFGIGLRLAARAAGELLDRDVLDEFKDWMDREGLYLFTMNGFPYGSFHHQNVKDNVYAPDWGRKERFEYTQNLVKILSELLPGGVDGGISTSPISYKYWDRDTEAEEKLIESACKYLAEIAYEMHQRLQNDGKELHLDIEPEPDCLIENSREAVQFFQNYLWPEGREYLAENKGMDPEEAVRILKEHIRLCYDTCHFAVEFEEPGEAVKRLTDAGIRIGKTQISSALKVELGSNVEKRKNIQQKLQAYVEPTYLHQVVEKRKDGSLRQYRDLPEALKNIDDADAVEWRIHFHVPIFTGRMGKLNSTRDHIINGTKPLLVSGCRHFEIETYTWEVLPETLKANLADSIEREFTWFLNFVTQKPTHTDA